MIGARVIYTVIVGTILAQVIWISLGFLLAMPSNIPTGWLAVMFLIHIACWAYAWRTSDRILSKWLRPYRS